MTDSTDLHKAGLKATLPRLRVLAILEQARGRHLTVEAVRDELARGGDDVGLATIYRVLTQFEQAGLVISHRFEGESAVFEINPGSHHDHLVCVECGRVFEFIDDTIEERQRHVAEQAGFVIENHSLSLYGVCEGMRKHGRCSKI